MLGLDHENFSWNADQSEEFLCREKNHPTSGTFFATYGLKPLRCNFGMEMSMRWIMSNKLAALLLILMSMGMLTACGEEGPAEQVGEAVDDAAEEAGDAVEDAADKVESATD